MDHLWHNKINPFQGQIVQKTKKKSKPGSREFEVNNINLKTFNRILIKNELSERLNAAFTTMPLKAAKSKNDARKTWKTINSLRDHKKEDDILLEFMTFDDRRIDNGQEIVNCLNSYFAEKRK